MQFTRRFGKHPSRENSATIPQTAFLLKRRLGGGLLTSFLRRKTTTQAKSQASIIHIGCFLHHAEFFWFSPGDQHRQSTIREATGMFETMTSRLEWLAVLAAVLAAVVGWRGKRGKHVEEALPGKAGAHALQTLPSRAPLAPDQSLSHPSAEGKVNYFDKERALIPTRPPSR